MATVPDTPRTNLITLASPSAGPFLVGFRLFSADGLEVYVDGVASTDWTLSADFTAGYDDAAEITFGSSLDTDTEIQIDGAEPPARPDDYLNPDPGLTRKLNLELARITAAVSEINMKLARTVRALNAIDPAAGVTAEDVMNLTTAAAETIVARDAVLAVEAMLPSWQGAWVTATAYVFGDIARQGGSTYFCVTPHTSGTFNTDLSNGYWEMFAQKGDAGAGTGDVVAANNGTEFDPATFRINLGLAIGVNVQAYNQLLGAVSGLASNGLMARLSGSTAAARTITGSGAVAVTDGDGVAGNPAIALTLASQAEAEAGTENTKPMTALRVAQALATVGGQTLLGTLTTAGTSIVLPDLTDWDEAYLVGMLDTTAAFAVQFGIAGPTWRTTGYVSDAHDGVSTSGSSSGIQLVRGSGTGFVRIHLLDLGSGLKSAVIGEAHIGSRRHDGGGYYNTAEANDVARLIGAGGTATFSNVNLRVYGVRRR